MTYLALFAYIILYSYVVKLNTKKITHFLMLSIPISTLLVMILGLQNDVGTDYFSYLSLADGTKGMGWIEGRNEILFVGLVNFVKKLHTPQLIFGVVAIIQVTFLMLICYEIRKLNLKLHYFFFLYFTLSLTFFNQFNGIRQYIAVYIVVYALLKLMYDKKRTFIILIIIASLFHSSAIFFGVFIFSNKILNKRLSAKKIILLLSGLLIISSLDIAHYIEMLLSYTSYRSYIGSSYFGRISVQGIITKIPKLIIVLISAYLIDKRNLKDKEIYLINLSYIGCGIQILSFASSLIWRFYQYIDLFIIFPVLILFNERPNKHIKILIALALIAMLVIKVVIVPRGEYLYRSILF